MYISDVETHLEIWTIPETSLYTIYCKGSFWSKSYYMKTVEGALPLTEGIAMIQLLSKRFIEKTKAKYHLIDLGLVQVAIKLLHKE